MLIDYAVIFIVALLPIVSLILVFQSNPYHALVIRAILGAVATLVFAVLGGADVALTEAMIGTLLAVALYIVAVRSTQVMRIGILCQTHASTSHAMDRKDTFDSLLSDIRDLVERYYLRLELIEYENLSALNQAMSKQEIHGLCIASKQIALPGENYFLSLRVVRLFEIFSGQFKDPAVTLNLAATKPGKYQ